MTRRLGAAVPDGGRLAAKSGALFGRIANEVAVIADAYAVAVLTRAHVPFRNQTRINVAMATVAAKAIETLRAG